MEGSWEKSRSVAVVVLSAVWTPVSDVLLYELGVDQCRQRSVVWLW